MPQDVHFPYESTLMARQSNTILLSAAMLALGLAVGGHLDSLQLSGKATARPAEAGSYGSPEALIQSGHHIGNVASRVMPSAVHIQATRRESDGRRVEETGSGVLMRNPKVKGLFIVTNNHVIRGAELSAIELKTHDGTRRSGSASLSRHENRYRRYPD